VASFFIEESHGDLAKNQAVLRATEEIIETGVTSTLLTAPSILRAAEAPIAWRRPASEYAVQEMLRITARRVEAEAAGPEETRIAEEALTCAFLGRELPRATPAAAPAAATLLVPKGPPPHLAIRVAQG